MGTWIKMVKNGEEKLVHPGNVDNHIRAGWQFAEVAPAAASPAEVQQESAEDTEHPEVEEVALPEEKEPEASVKIETADEEQDPGMEIEIDDEEQDPGMEIEIDDEEPETVKPGKSQRSRNK